MENRNVSPDYREESSRQVPVEGFVRGIPLSTEDLHQLIDFFLLLDHWDRELVQNGSNRDEVRVCRMQ